MGENHEWESPVRGKQDLSGLKGQDQDMEEQIADVQDMDRRRKWPRLSSVYSAKLAQKGKVYSCVVTNLSLMGARIKLTHPVDIHAPLRLMFDRLGDYWALKARVVWSTPGMIGVQLFDSEATCKATLHRLMPHRFEQVSQ